MVKQRTVFVCQQCGTESPKWMGRCSNCGEWNSLVETIVSTTRRDADPSTSLGASRRGSVPQKLSQIKSVRRTRIKTGMGELDRVLGGGVVPGSMVLVAGEPGIGKSTLMLQLAASVAKSKVRSLDKESKAKNIRNSPGLAEAKPRAGKFEIPNPVLYISGEESPQQLKIRAERLAVKSDNLLFLAETNVESILSAISNQQSNNLAIVIIDSIQTLTTDALSGTAGSVGQVRECAARLLRVGKSLNIPIFLIGHVTKAGAIAGPKVLEHMVDTVLYLEGERFSTARLLRATKNRFGATDEVGVFEMKEEGMEEVNNPSRLFLKERVKKVPGSVVVATMEGTRPMLAEIQALVVPTKLTMPRRIGQGIGYYRLQLITAILTKRLRLPLGSSDIFVNVTGGLRVKEPAVDLGIALAIISSFKNIALDPQLACFGELGLLGELREVGYPEKRCKEARRLGFTTIISSENFSSIGQVAKRLSK